MGQEDLIIIGRVTGALVIGALIGFERTFHGRPAGFRTHSLVCIASAILMIVTVYQNQWMTFLEHDAIRTDPARMAQGIMTGQGDEMRLLRALRREHPHADFVFLSERKAPLSVDGAQKLIERLGESAELPFPIHAHMLRHAAGYALAARGIDTRTLQAWPSLDR
jgi:DNA-binding NarL/FixJ family response regulator